MNPLPVRLTPGGALAQLNAETTFVSVFTHGSLEIEIYRPVGGDPQTAHDRDEVYAVLSGNGIFSCAGERRPFAPGEVLFVAAGVEHRFEQFTPDFATWVFFYGPDGGESANKDLP